MLKSGYQVQWLDQIWNNKHLKCFNRVYCPGLDAKIDDLSEQLSRLQSLNRSLQAQNFNLSTSLSHKDVTFDKLKKYLHKGRLTLTVIGYHGNR